MSQVIVIDSAFRRHVIKTTPEKRLNDILNEACTKFGVNPDIYVLKYEATPPEHCATAYGC